MDAATDRFSLVPGTHRLIRTIDGKEGPFAGALVAYGDGVAVSVAAERLAAWPGWAYSNAEHVCGVLDLRRRPDGQDALLPWCTQRVESFLGRRQMADAPLTGGELATLVASVLRGLRELGGEESAAGDWWLTGDGRPVFVHGAGGVPRARTAALVERAAQHTTDRATIRILDEIVAGLRQPRHHVDDEQRWEGQLFDIAAPRALRLDIFAPERVSGSSAQRAISTKGLPETRAARRRMKPERTVHRWSELMAAARERAAALVSRVPGRARFSRRRLESTAADQPRFRRRRSLLLAGSIGVAVLVIGLMWPNGGSEENAEAAASPATSAPVAPPSESSTADRPVGRAEALSALPALLESINECVDESQSMCPDAVAEKAQIPSDGLVLLGADASSAVLVEDYGDVAVVRLTPKSEGVEQMLVLERHNELWLLRDVYDVAKQPE